MFDVILPMNRFAAAALPVFSREFHARILSIFVLPIILVAISGEMGCKKQQLHTIVPVSGTVMYNGKPLQFGTIMFQPEAGQFATGTIQADGTFQMKIPGEGNGAAVGKNSVCISCLENDNPEVMNKFKSSSQASEFYPGKSLIPLKYRSCDTSGITVEVLPDGNDSVIINLTN